MIPQDMKARLERRLETIRSEGKDTIGDMLQLQLVSCDTQKGEFLIRGKTDAWMRNLAGTLHGGICATFVDQCLGLVAYCLKEGQGVTPTLDMTLHYHRPPMPGEDVLVCIRLVSMTKSIIHMGAEVCMASNPGRICISGSGTSYFKERK